MRKVIGIGETVLDIIFKANKPHTAVPGEGKYPGSGYYNKGGSYTTSQSRKEQVNFNSNLMVDKQINEDWHVNGFLRYELYNGRKQQIKTNTKGEFIVPNQYFA